MKDKFSNLEVLSPAGNAETFYAAINAGADAIYLGLSAFNARMKAENFTEDNIRSFVEYAHSFNIKIYITLNTLITDEDVPKIIELVKVLTDARVDAFIIQDFGIAKLLKTCFKNITLHSSTQMGIHNLDGAKIAEKIGITRIVLSRETKLDDIKLIHENTNLEIEYFVQGALCVAFSGNCYLSALEKNMSGNEGKCLGLCRLPYHNSLTNENAYNLSARDISLLENLSELIDAGVTSFKIEGRMRHAGYAAITTKTYKDALKLLSQNEMTSEWLKTQQELLKTTYSRGEFNKNAYLDRATPNDIINKDYQNHIGIKIGSVVSVRPFKNELNRVQITSNYHLKNGDGIKIINEKTKEQVASLGVGNVNQIDKNLYDFVTKYKFSKDLSVFLTQNCEIENQYLSLKRKVKLNLQIAAFANQKLKIKAWSNGVATEYESDFILQTAKNAPLSKTDFFNQFNKLESSIFTLNEFQFESDSVFVPKSLLNEARRQIVTMMQAKIISSNEKIVASFDEEQYQNLMQQKAATEPKNIAIINETVDIFNEKLNDFDFIVLAPTTYSLNIIKPICEKFGSRFALNLPTILNCYDKQILDGLLKELPKDIHLFANNLYGVNYLTEYGYNIILSPLLNIKNKLALLLFNDFQIKTICASIEADNEFINHNSLIEFSGGRFPLMTFAHCPIKTIFSSSCQNCKFSNAFSLTNDNLGSYNVDRNKIFSCYFELFGKIPFKNSKFMLLNYSK